MIDPNELDSLDCSPGISWSALEASDIFYPGYENEETLDVKNKELPWACAKPLETVYQAQLGPPPKNNHPGQYNFQISITSEACKKKYMYSHKLNRIYVDMQVTFPIMFSWDYGSVYENLFVRATTAFSAEDQAEKRVERCLNHKYCEKSNIDGCDNIRMHVLRSARPYGSGGVFYYGEEVDKTRWYSVLLPFPTRPPDGNKEFVHPYEFACKNSCNSGINRRSIEIVFTLEDERGKVLGRQCVGVKVCSCPKRDVKKDEADAAPVARPEKRKITQPEPPPSKRPATDVKTENKVFYLAVGSKKNFKMLEPIVKQLLKADAAEASSNDKEELFKLIKQNEDMFQNLDSQ